MKNQIENTPREVHHSTKSIKVIVMFIFFSVFFIGTASAVMEWDNVLSYEENDLKVVVYNFFNLPIFGEKIGSATLKSHQTVTEILQVIRGKDRVVMYYDFNFTNGYKNGLGKVYFKDMRTGKVIQKDYYFAKEIREDVIVPDYKTNCVVEQDLGNGTIIENCSRDVVGNHIENKFIRWEKLNNNDIPKGVTRIALITDVNKGDYIDAVWTIAGKKVSRHSEWTESLNTGLIAYYNFDEVNGSTVLDNDLDNATLDGTYLGVGEDTNWVTGLLGNAFNFSPQVGNSFNMTYSMDSLNGTINLWINPGQVSDSSILGRDGETGGIDEGEFFFGFFSGSKTVWRVAQNASFKSLTSDSGIQTNGVYTMITVTWNATGYQMYLNSTLQSTYLEATQGPVSAFGCWGLGDKLASGSCANPPAPGVNGTLDEFGYWNIELTQSKVTQLYNGGTGITHRSDFAPVITTFSPTNTTFTTSTIFFNASANQAIENWTVNYNGTNITDFSINTTLTVEDGFHQAFFYANNSAGDLGVNSDIFFTVDSTNPLISYVSPTENNNTIFSRDWIFVNVTVTETNEDTITFVLFNSTSQLNSTSFTDSTRTINFTNLPDETYTYNVTVNDTAGNSNTTETRFITLDTTNPAISYETPTTPSGNTTQTFIEVNVTASDTNLDSIIIYIYNSSSLVQSNISTSSPLFVNLTGLPDETYTVNATANDTTNNLNSTSDRTITIDTIAPQVTVTFPNETLSFQEININLSVNWTVSDSGAGLDTCTLEYDGVNTTVTCLDNSTNINITSITNKSLVFYVNDTLGNSNSSSVSWNYKIFQNSLNYILSTIGGNTETFTLNITKLSSLQISTVDLVYNESASTASFTSGDTSIVTNTLIVPNPSADSNLSFFFSFTLDDDSIINTSSNNQTVLNFAIGNCSTFSTLIYNFTMFDEVNLTKLTNVTIDYAFNLFDNTRTTQIINFSASSTANPTQICINQNLTAPSSYSLDAVLQYLSSDAVGYLTRYYNILNFSLKNSTIPNNISIYDVVDTTATPFQLTFRDSSLVPDPNILVNVDKQYVPSNDFKTVEIPITDTSGQTILNLVRNTAIYNLIFVDAGGNIVASFNKISVFCDIAIQECTLDLDAPATIESKFNLSSSIGISYTLAYTNSTSTATLTFSSLNSTALTARIIGTTQNQFGNRSVCDSSLTSTLGTVDCDASSILLTDNYLFVDIFSNGNYVETRVININPQNPLVGGLYGANGYFIAFLMLLFIIILFSDDKQVLLVMLGVGWVVILVFGLVKGAIIGSVSGGIWLLISIITMIWKLKQEESGK